MTEPDTVTTGRFRMVDLDFAIESDHPLTARFFERALAPFRADGSPAHRYTFRTIDAGARIEVSEDGTRVLSPRSENLVPVFLWHLNQRVMLHTVSRLTVHAGVVSLGDAGVVIPGVAGAGKSTLVAALVADGFELFSDEGALVSLDRPAVEPYRRWLSLEEGSWPFVPSLQPPEDAAYDQSRQWLIPAQELPGRHERESCTPVAVVFPQVREGAATQLHPVSRAQTVRDLSREATNLVVLGEQGFASLVDLVRGASCWRLVLDGVEDAVEQVRALVTQGG